MAFPTGWAWKSKLTVKAGMIIGTLTDFPVVITADIINAQAPGMLTLGDAQAAENGGGDIRCSLDVDGVTQLPVEVTLFTLDANPANAFATIFVKVPSVADGTEIYLWWGKPGETQPAAADPFGSQNVWDANFLYVHHCNSNNDSTANGIVLTDGVNPPVNLPAAQALLDAGFDSSIVGIPSAKSFMGLGGMAAQRMTIETLLIHDGDINHTNIVVDMRDAAVTEAYVYRWQFNGGSNFNRFYFFDTLGGINSIEGLWNLFNYVQATEWFYTACVYDQNVMKIMRSPGSAFEPPNPFLIEDISAVVGAKTVRQIDAGAYGRGTADYFSGYMTEMRVSNIDRSDPWLSATSINMRDNISFWDMDPPLAALGGGLIIPVWVPGI